MNEHGRTSLVPQSPSSPLLVLFFLLPLILSLHSARDYSSEEYIEGYNLSYKAYPVISEPEFDKTPYRRVDIFDLRTVLDERGKQLKLFLWSHVPEESPRPTSKRKLDNLRSTLQAFRLWMAYSDSVITLTPDALLPSYCAGVHCSSNEVCKPHFYCLMKLGIPQLALENRTELVPNRAVPPFRKCLVERYNINKARIESSTWTCSISLTSTRYSFEGLAPDQTEPCVGKSYALTIENWKKYHVEMNLHTALKGGVDEYGVYWEGRRGKEPIATTIGRQFWDQLSEQCSIKSPCEPDINCQSIGSFTGLALGGLGGPMRIPWVILLSAAVKNLNLQLRNTHDQVLKAISSLALDTFSTDDFSPAKDPNTDIKNNLAGFGSILTILGGIVPVAGQALDLVGTITSGVGDFIANKAPPDEFAAQKTFAQNALTYYEGLRDGLDNFTTQLFAGTRISGPAGSFNLSDMLQDGIWVNTSALTDVSQLNSAIRTEVKARSIDAIWKKWPKNKMWVLFTDLQDNGDNTKCLQDVKGPNKTKYCADGGVYYAYNFIEDGLGGGGNVGYPWGGEQLESRAHIPLNLVTEASARTYQFNKQRGRDPFSFNHSTDTREFLTKFFADMQNNGPPLSAQVGRLPGSWTLPVCNASTWGAQWNWDYTQTPQPFGVYETHPPCICGKSFFHCICVLWQYIDMNTEINLLDNSEWLADGTIPLGPLALETYDWAKAAGLQGFKTFWGRCEVAMRRGHFNWPDGVTFIDYPTNNGDEVHKIHKP
ncbi:MAG: hypothetical protein L6R35_001578 [Caloplaca aegaea]|nr:MAG: hypothetical protein L6R35_001578 [Caloplaca aegaea]